LLAETIEGLPSALEGDRETSDRSPGRVDVLRGDREQPLDPEIINLDVGRRILSQREQAVVDVGPVRCPDETGRSERKPDVGPGGGELRGGYGNTGVVGGVVPDHDVQK